MSETSYLDNLPATHGEAWRELSQTVCEHSGDAGCLLIDSVKRCLRLRGRDHQESLVAIAASVHGQICGQQCPYHTWAGYGKAGDT